MLNLIQQFAAEDIHVSLKAEPLFHIGPIPVSNSLLYGIICGIIIVVVMAIAARKITYHPGKSKLANGVEYLVGFIMDLISGSLGSRELAVRFAPFYLSIFSIIIFSYLLSLFPVVSEGLYVTTSSGAHAPLFRAFTADLNATLAMAIIAILAVQFMSIKTQGFKMHFQHYFSDKPWNPINMVIGIIEVFGELTRILSLALRLFLNTAVGDILIVVFASLAAAGGRTPVTALPIFLFEILVAGIQSYVFTVLVATYLGLAVSHALEHHDDDHQTPALKDTMVEAQKMVKEPTTT